MRTKAILTGSIAAIALAVSLTGCSSPSTSGEKQDNASTSSSSAADATTRLTGTFAGLNGKKVSGTVSISGSTVTLSGFASDEGPDLHLYLANGTTEAAVAAGTEIDAVAYDKDAQTFTLGNKVDASSYTDLVVHCDKAKVSFGAAELDQ